MMKFGHVAIRVKDLERTLNFYCHALELKEAFRINNSDGSLRIVYLHISDKQYLEICLGGKEKPEFSDKTSIGIRHICLVVNNLEKSKKEMEKRGVFFDSEILDMRDNNLAAFLFDPDGNKIELVQIKKGSPHQKFESAL